MQRFDQIHEITYSTMGTNVELTVLATARNGIPGLGRNRMQALGMDSQSTRSSRHQEFQSLYLSQDAVLYVHKPRIVSFSIKRNEEYELNRLVKQNVMEEVDPLTTFLDLACPTVNVLKTDWAIRICAYFQTTVKKYISQAHYPLLRLEALLEKLRGEHYIQFMI
ncbi:hypothetical protein RF11_07380 [Thelohanellus kitauei]|uniref:Uncharacterized protein n=1 Tax=Thelohanellus kitauei TaxID=669202 RepID=A0A0C2IUZ4_THEKT|nr:hypothetical protein RF11_07380 [Thelohanellus kitauei]